MWWQRLNTVVKSFLSSFSREFNKTNESSPPSAWGVTLKLSPENSETYVKVLGPQETKVLIDSPKKSVAEVPLWSQSLDDLCGNFPRSLLEQDSPSDPAEITAPFETAVAEDMTLVAAEMLQEADLSNVFLGRFPDAKEPDARWCYGGQWAATAEGAYQKYLNEEFSRAKHSES